MHRSASTSRASDEFFLNMSPQMKGSPGLKSAEMDQLPTYDPLSDIAKKEAWRLRNSENAVHVIPVVLIFCAIVLWFFSHPVNVANMDDSIVARIEGLKISGYTNLTTLPPLKENEDLDTKIDDDEVSGSTKLKPE